MLIPMTESALADVMRIERMPGYEAFVGRWERDVHLAEMASPDARYLIWQVEGAVTGFTILQAFRQSIVRLRRIAVSTPSSGTGTQLLRSAVDWVFSHAHVAAIDLQVKHNNQRAKTVYLREGFAFEGEGEGDDHERMVMFREVWSTLARRPS